MEPIMPARNQRLSPAFFDEDKDGESDYVLIPYCINGSYYDDDPGNNTIQVALKYKLVTARDLQGKTPRERLALEKRMGLWMWAKPVEILISFDDHPGPDIVFNDRGIVIDGWVIDPAPDGEFDHFEFLF